MHPLLSPPTLPTAFLSGELNLTDKDIARICDAFIKAEGLSHKEDIWTELVTSNQPFIDALRGKDLKALRHFFSNLFHGPLLFGMGHTAVFLSKKCPYDLNYFSLRCRDSVLSLAEALAIKGIPSNQQTSLANYLKDTNGNLEPLIEQIEQKLGHSVTAPDVGKPPVAYIGQHAVSADSIRHAYVMYRVKQLGFYADSRILEIGGGFGNVARYAYLQGFRDYTIVDLPYVAAIQAAYLFATIGPDKVMLFGETKPAPIKVMPSTHKQDIPGQFDLAMNMDSLPEINMAESLDYLKLVKAKARHFLSINQEARKTHRGKIQQHSVPELMQKIEGFKLLHRHIYWMEQGYAEEFYKLAER